MVILPWIVLNNRLLGWCVEGAWNAFGSELEERMLAKKFWHARARWTPFLLLRSTYSTFSNGCHMGCTNNWNLTWIVQSNKFYPLAKLLSSEFAWAKPIVSPTVWRFILWVVLNTLWTIGRVEGVRKWRVGENPREGILDTRVARRTPSRIRVMPLSQLRSTFYPFQFCHIGLQQLKPDSPCERKPTCTYDYTSMFKWRFTAIGSGWIFQIINHGEGVSHPSLFYLL